ncbi:6190_t:CDS:2 [Ambispora gerdemannii]|uniref:6190_t:CDS:1 n=1 Tax=Ambispora gerdemannii TaxID=144530 RepID=A0A9N8WGN7_9GLOM|nr:6190_t:CDS:2 [Ambispora gerdemannii]
MSVNVPGYKSSPYFEQLKTNIEANPESYIKKAKGTYEFHIKNKDDKEQTWTIELKDKGAVTAEASKSKPDIVLTLTDDVFVDLVDGKLNGQKAFMQGKLKVKGNVMLATKLDGVLKAAKAKL